MSVLFRDDHNTVVANGVVAHKDKTKNQSSNRTYPLIGEVREILLRLKQQQDEYRELFGNCYTETGYVFTREDGKTYYPDFPTKHLKKVLERNNLPHLTWHGLRHSCASMMVIQGYAMKDISDWLGHADISTTMNIYAHIDLEHKREVGNGLSGVFSD